MSDIMRPIPFGSLMNWILAERKQKSQVFGVARPFVMTGEKTLSLFGEKLETPFGPAAGPHTQLSQNIIAAYYAGSRFFELKTVQTLDGEDLPVAKPCIDAADECYNCEWSTELRVPQAFAEYVRAWYALKLISREFGLGQPDGFMFNMSVGYDLEGIKSPKIDSFIEGLKDASGTEAWRECREWTLANLERFSRVDRDFVDRISPKVCTSITLSTLHGCPPQEIERIAAYLIEEKGLNTFVKCNPTMLGYEFARRTLDELGFGYVEFDDHHFKGDLQFEDAAPMFRRLLARAEARGLSFGLKLTNTCPVDNRGDALPGEEMYMSGRALYPLTVALARKLSREFRGSLRISYSGGADYYNIGELYAAGIWPITLATTLLKPGGYQRLTQIAEKLLAMPYKEFTAVDVAALDRIADGLGDAPRNRKSAKPLPPRKLAEKVPLFDCFTNPCQGGCPIHQDIPAYVTLAGEGRYLEALKVILEKNPLPFITGTICGHRCMEKCTRNFYEEPVRIRQTKLLAAERGYEELLAERQSGAKAEAAAGAKGKAGGDAPKARVAVVGGGPAGMAAAYFLAREKVPVTVFEKAASLGGVVRQVIPEFRIADAAIDKDVELLKATGAEIRTACEVKSPAGLAAAGYSHLILAIGAWRPGRLVLEEGQALDALEFLRLFKADDPSLALGRRVVVAGGGNTAMDAARAARRWPGVEKVSLVYRRDRRYMPADEEELALALEDGVEFLELLAPASLKDGVLTCEKMALGAPGPDGRRQPGPTGQLVKMPCDRLISAVGEGLDSGFYAGFGLSLDSKGRPELDEGTGEVKRSGEKTDFTGKIYVAGDGRRGPATVVEAIADSARIARAILLELGLSHREHPLACSHGAASAIEKRGVLCTAAEAGNEGERCLDCGTVCESCVQVCPNRANIWVRIEGKEKTQIVHMDGMCNECGNCATFCPYDSAPYQDKLTLFDNMEDFENSENQGFVLTDRERGAFMVRLEGHVFKWCPREAKLKARVGGEELKNMPDGLRSLLAALLFDYDYLLK